MDRTHVFCYPWDCVTTAVWRKYPHPLAPNLKTIDTFDAEIINNKLCVRRVASYKHGWGPTYFSVENIIVDPVNRMMTVETKNITGSSLATISEKCEYKVDPDQPSHTRFTAKTHVECTSFVCKKLEEVLRAGALHGPAILTDRIKADIQGSESRDT